MTLQTPSYSSHLLTLTMTTEKLTRLDYAASVKTVDLNSWLRAKSPRETSREFSMIAE